MRTPPREGARKKGDDIRVVVADPHAIDRGGLVWLIDHEHGFEVVGEAANAVEAMQQCKTLSPDVLVITMNLPDQSEEAIVPMLLRKLPGLKVVALSDRGASNCVVLNPPSRKRGGAK